MSIIDNIKDVANIVRKADNIDLYRQILDLQQEALELVEENYSLKENINRLEDSINIQEKLTFKDNMYYLVDGPTESGPFCSACWDQDDKLVRLHENSWDMFVCPVCVKK